MRDNITRRRALAAIGAVGVSGGIGVGSVAAEGSDVRDLRLLGEASVDGAMETVAQDGYAYVATGKGMGVVDVRDPGQLKTVANVNLSDDLDPAAFGLRSLEISVKDVKVEGNVAALANDREGPGGIALYDVSDPTNPEYLAFYEPEPPSNIHNCFLDGNYAYLGLGEPWNTDTDGDGERDLVRLFGDSGVEIVDVSDPANPTRASTWLLKESLLDYAKGAVSTCHDLYAQDGLVYCAFWDAGTLVLDATDPSNPTLVSQFGAAPKADEEVRPWNTNEESVGEYFDEVFPFDRYLAPPGNAHYVQPSPDGGHVYVGAETFLGEPGGIDVWNVADLGAPQKVGRVDPPAADGLRTAHNFDVTANRLVASWYNGGVHTYDVSDPSDPTELAAYNPDGYAFWAAVRDRGFTIGGVYGARSSDHAGGVVVLSEDSGVKRPPAFDGSAPPERPEVRADERATE